MARYEHLPIFREAYDFTVYIEKLVRNFSRYNKYTLGSKLKDSMRTDNPFQIRDISFFLYDLHNTFLISSLQKTGVKSRFTV